MPGAPRLHLVLTSMLAMLIASVMPLPASAVDCRAYATKSVEQAEEWSLLNCRRFGTFGVEGWWWVTSWNKNHDWCTRWHPPAHPRNNPRPEAATSGRAAALAVCRAKVKAQINSSSGGSIQARCQQYAQKGVAQTLQYNSRRCKGGDPGWWKTDFSWHYKWCFQKLSQSPPDIAIVNAGTSNRQAVLDKCAGAAPQGCNWMDISVKGDVYTDATCKKQCNNIPGCRGARASGPPDHGCFLCMN